MGFEVLNYVFSNPPGNESKIFENKEKKIYLPHIHRIQEPLEFCEYR